MEHQKYLYLATPHTHSEAEVREFRARSAMKVVYISMLGGVQGLGARQLYSPIGHFHWAHHLLGSKEPNFSRYVEHDFTMIRNSAGLLILPVKENRTSIGVQSEMAFAYSVGIPVYVLEPHTDGRAEIFYIRELPAATRIVHPRPWEAIDLACDRFLGIKG